MHPKQTKPLSHTCLLTILNWTPNFQIVKLGKMNGKLSIPSLICHQKADTTWNSKILQATSSQPGPRVQDVVVLHCNIAVESLILVQAWTNSLWLTYCPSVCLHTYRYCRLQIGHTGKWEKEFVITPLWKITHRNTPKCCQCFKIVQIILPWYFMKNISSFSGQKENSQRSLYTSRSIAFHVTLKAAVITEGWLY